MTLFDPGATSLRPWPINPPENKGENDMKQKVIPIIALVVLITATLACGGGKSSPTPVPATDVPAPTDAPQPTQTPVPPTPTAVPTPAPTPTPEPQVEPGWHIYTNGNYVREIALLDGVLWAATGGGIVSWDVASGEPLGKYTTLDGLLTNDVTAITVCPIPEPRVIAGNEYGLALYDSETDTWEPLNSKNSGMVYDDVESLDCEPESHLLLVGYVSGLDIYEADEDEWHFVDEDDGLASDWVNQAAFVGDDLWIVSSFGVSVVHADGSVDAYDEDTTDIPDENVSAVAGDAQGNVWLAAFDGLLKFSDGAWTIYNSDNVDKFPFLDAFTGVAVAADGAVWAGNTFGTLCQFDPAKETCRVIYEDEAGMVGGLNDLLMDDAGSIYYCDDGEGISVFDDSSWRALALDERPVANSYEAITQMADGYVYAGGSFGLHIFAAEDADGEWVHNDMEGYTVNTFYHTPDGVWMGHGAGASYYDYATEEWTNYDRAEEAGQGIYDGGVSAITVDGRRRVWFGTWNGLTVMDGSTFTYYDLLDDAERADDWSPRTVYALQFDGQYVWVGAYGALFRFDEQDEMTRWDSELPGVPSVWSLSTSALALDAEDHVLLAMGSRLLTYDATADTFEELVEAPGSISSILVTDQGEMWLGLSYDGAYHFDGSEWTQLTTEEYGLPSNRLSGQSILMDDLGTVWFAGEHGGLARYAP
jgi:ligand-binding sensor domain-containing protein